MPRLFALLTLLVLVPAHGVGKWILVVGDMPLRRQLQSVVATLLCVSGTATAGPEVVQIDGAPLVRLAVADGSDIRFARITRTQGLSQTRVAKLVQDDLGFIWFGTQYGLNRFDGYRFKVFA